MSEEQAPLQDRIRRIPAAELRARAAEAARRSRRRVALLVPLVAAVLVAYAYRQQLFGVDTPVRITVAAVLLVLGWALAANVGRLFQPKFEASLEPGTSGVVGFTIRLVTLAVAVLASLRIAGLKPGTLAAGAGFTAIVFGLAAQQTIGNVFAGIVLLSARPFRVGDRVRFNGFGMDVEGTVAGQGLLYVMMRDGDDLVLVPNNTALTMSARPIREPAAVDMRARLPREVDPEAVQRRVTEGVTVATRGSPHIGLEEFEGRDVVMRVRATPVDSAQGGRLAREVLRAVSAFAEDRDEAERRGHEDDAARDGSRRPLARDGAGDGSSAYPGAAPDEARSGA